MFLAWHTLAFAAVQQPQLPQIRSRALLVQAAGSTQGLHERSGQVLAWISGIFANKQLLHDADDKARYHRQ
jgi:hypothetical protein